MSKKVNIHRGTLEGMGKRFVSAWHRLERGERVRERRMALAERLGAITSACMRTLKPLAASGLVRREESGLSAPHGAISAEMRLQERQPVMVANLMANPGFLGDGRG